MNKRKLFDEHGFLFGKISVVDILAVLLVAALALMLYVRFYADEETPGSVASTGKEKVEYVVKISGARELHCNTMRPGDTVYNGEYGIELGTVKEVRIEPTTALMTRLDGTVAEVPVEGYYNIYITIEAECTASAGGYYLGGSIELNVNMGVQLVTIYDNMGGTVISVG